MYGSITNGIPADRTRSAKVRQVSHFQDHAVVGNRNRVAVDRIVSLRVGAVLGQGGLQMDDKLVAKHIEVDPPLITASFGKTQDGAVKMSSFRDIPDWYRDVKRG
jgi:hypothetical protein